VFHPFLDAIRQIAKLDSTVFSLRQGSQTRLTKMRIRLLLALWLVAAAAGAGRPPRLQRRTSRPAKLRGPGEGLKNVLTVKDKLVSGSAPGDDVDFRALRDMGVKRSVSVDGATPDLEARPAATGCGTSTCRSATTACPATQALRIRTRGPRLARQGVPATATTASTAGRACGRTVALCLDEEMKP